MSWSLGGNVGTNPPNDFLGTGDDEPVVFKSNGTENMRIRPDGSTVITGLLQATSPAGIPTDFTPFTAISGDASNSTFGTGVLGLSVNGSGVGGSSQEQAGVSGESVTGRGVVGVSGTNQAPPANAPFYHPLVGTGVYGRSDMPGRLAEFLIGGGFGVYGENNQSYGIGVAGFSTPNDGSGVGVLGYSTDGVGIQGKSASSNAVEASSTTGNGVVGTSGDTTDLGGAGVAGVAWNVGVWAVNKQLQSGNVVSANNAYLGSRCCAGDFYGEVDIHGQLNNLSPRIRIDHPLDPANKYLCHASVASPDMKNMYDGEAVIDAHGEASVELPPWFGRLNHNFRYQLTAIGSPGPNLHVSQEITNNRFKIGGGVPGMRVSWQVTGIRRDAWANAHPVQVEEDKQAERGYYLEPEVHGEPAEKGVRYARYPDLEPPRIRQVV